MAATITRRVWRRARLGGRHTYRSAARHRAALAVTTAVAAVVAGSAVAVAHEPPPGFVEPPFAHARMHGPMPGGPPGDVPERPWLNDRN